MQTGTIPLAPASGAITPAPDAGGSLRPGAEVRLRRISLVAAGALTATVGLFVHFRGSGPVADFTADALYAVLAYIVIAVVAPRARRSILLASAFVFCAAVEVLQVTGLPQALGDTFPPARLLLGSTFSTTDLLAYGAGVLAIVAADSGVRWLARPLTSPADD